MWYKVKHIYCWTNLIRPLVPATSITLNKSSISLTTAWQTSQLTATLTPSWSTSTVSWTSSNTSIATVSSSWLVTCVTPWSCTITATTDNGLTATCSVTKSRLPSTYQEVEYIQSSWTQYIDTWKTVSWDCKIDYTYMPMQNTDNYAFIWMDNDWRSNWFGSWNSYIYYGWYTSNNEWYTVGSVSNGVKCRDVCWKSGCSRTLNWNTVSYIPSGSYPSPSWTLTLFVWRRNWSIQTKHSTRMYEFKRWDSWTLTQNLVPCYRKSDSVIWLYDLVSWSFFTNAWTGTFTKWWNVN